MTRLSVDQAFEIALNKFRSGQPASARELCQKILAAQPDHADAMHMLGALALQQGNLNAAVDLFGKAIALYRSADDLAEAQSNLGIALSGLQQFDAAIAAHRQSLSLRPDSAESNNNLGFALQGAGKDGEAEPYLRRAIALRSEYPDALNNLANLLHGRGEYAQAVQLLERAQTIDPQFASAHWNLALILLLLGESARGWREYEWRLKLPGYRGAFSRFSQPRWDGSPLVGRRLLLHSEQGLGDAIHFARYIGRVADPGAKITLACHAPLLTLFESLPGVDRLVCADEPPGDFDLHCPLPSLPLTLGLPDPYWPGPYLKSDARRVEKFADILRLAQNRFKVGLIWQGRPYPPGRSIPLVDFKSLAMDGVQLFGLQVGPGNEQVHQAGFPIINAGPLIRDFADMAALMQQMDLIVSIDSAPAQLAGAMGLEVWVLLKKVPDWRWMLERSDSPWYPSIRLFRQNQFNQWQDVIAEVARQLRERA